MIFSNASLFSFGEPFEMWYFSIFENNKLKPDFSKCYTYTKTKVHVEVDTHRPIISKPESLNVKRYAKGFL